LPEEVRLPNPPTSQATIGPTDGFASLGATHDGHRQPARTRPCRRQDPRCGSIRTLLGAGAPVARRSTRSRTDCQACLRVHRGGAYSALGQTLTHCLGHQLGRGGDVSNLTLRHLNFLGSIYYLLQGVWPRRRGVSAYAVTRIRKFYHRQTSASGQAVQCGSLRLYSSRPCGAAGGSAAACSGSGAELRRRPPFLRPRPLAWRRSLPSGPLATTASGVARAARTALLPGNSRPGGEKNWSDAPGRFLGPSPLKVRPE
jgi:hypothetical protein